MRLSPLICAALMAVAARAETAPHLPIKIKLERDIDSGELSIYAGVNGGHPVAYSFDTGSDAFIIAPSTWRNVRDPKPVTKMKKPAMMMYGDNTYGYSYLPVWARVAFFQPNVGRPVLSLPASPGCQVAKIVEQIFDYEPGKRIDVKSKATTDTGIFGARSLIETGGDATVGEYQLSTPLLQVPGAEGIVVADNGPYGTASVVVGLNQAIRDQFPMKITVPQEEEVFPGSNLHACGESVVDLTFSGEGREPVTIHSGIGLDTGSSKGYSLALSSADADAVKKYLVEDKGVDRDKNTEVTKMVKVGTLITFSFPGRKDGFHYSFRSTRTNARSNSGLMYVTVIDAADTDVTAGIGFFEHFAVMYDVKNSELGFRDKPPDLSRHILHPAEADASATPPILTWPSASPKKP